MRIPDHYYTDNGTKLFKPEKPVRIYPGVWLYPTNNGGALSCFRGNRHPELVSDEPLLTPIIGKYKVLKMDTRGHICAQLELDGKDPELLEQLTQENEAIREEWSAHQ